MPPVRSLLLCCAVVAVAPASESWILRPEEPWSFSWEERRLANADGVSAPGFGRCALPVEPGLWGEAGAELLWSSDAQALLVPGTTPQRRGAQGHAWAEAWGAWGPLFVHLRPEVLLGDGEARIPHPIARDIWTGAEPTAGLDAIETTPRASLGVSGLGHVLALSTEPFRWGDGIFGGVVMGGSGKGFPHVVLATRGPQQPAPSGSWLEPLALSYELVVGRLNDAKPVAGDDVLFTGFRAAVRWDAVTLSWTKALLSGGSAQPAMSTSDLLRTLFNPPDGSETAAPGEPNPNRMVALGLRLDWPRNVAWSVDFGLDDNRKQGVGHGLEGSFLGAWNSGAWTMTADWLDITGDGDWRAAVEWFRSESYVYDHSVAPWDDHGAPLGHPDGGNANSLRLLMQHVDADDGHWTALATARRLGWRNADSGNPNTARGDPGVPGSSSYARLPWDALAFALRLEQPFARTWRWSALAGATYDRNRMFVAGDDSLSGEVGAGLAVSW